MLSKTIFATGLLAGLVAGQTPSGFSPSVSKPLDVYYGTTYITPGLMVKKSVTQKVPTIGLTNATTTGKYLLAMIDIDVPSGSSRTTILHALLQDFTASGQSQNGSSVLTTKATGPTSYMGPAPPNENPKHPHNYIFLLHEQPDNFAVPSSQKSVVQNRMGVNWPKFITDAGLKDPIGATYMQVQSGDNTMKFVA